MVKDAIHAFTYINKSKNTHSVEVDFMVEMADDTQVIQLNPYDHSEYKFVDLKGALELWPNGDEEKVAVLRGFEWIKLVNNR